MNIGVDELLRDRIIASAPKPEHMGNCSSVFIFKTNVKPVACDINFMLKSHNDARFQRIFARPEYADIYPTLAEEILHDTIRGENEPLTGTKYRYRFQDTIDNMIFKFGLKRELYKNQYGQWIDMTKIKQNMGVLITALGVMTTVTDRIAYDVADSIMFQNVDRNSPYFHYIVDADVIPEVDWIDKDGIIHRIQYKDGNDDSNVVFPKMFELKDSNMMDTVHSDSNKIRFRQRLARATDETFPLNDLESATMDDLCLDFFDMKGNPYTNLDNLLVTVNGMFVDYKRSSKYENSIFIPDCVKLADIQRIGLKNNLVTRTLEHHENSITSFKYDIPTKNTKFALKFGIRIYQFDGVEISHLQSPIHEESYLKREIVADARYYLTNKLIFGEEIDRDNAILVCNGEIIPKTEWSVDPLRKTSIILTNVNMEFDFLYTEMRKKLDEYLDMMYETESLKPPELDYYLQQVNDTDGYTTKDALEDFRFAMDDFITKYVEDGRIKDIYSILPALDLVAMQFRMRSYHLIRFNAPKNKNYKVKVRENRSAFKINYPSSNKIQSIGWSIDDINIINGLRFDMINEYADVISLPHTSYRPPSEENYLSEGNCYRLEVLKL